MKKQTPAKKRFIAGASCPSCKSVDTIMMQKLEEGSEIECIDCGYKERQVKEQELIGMFKPV